MNKKNVIAWWVLCALSLALGCGDPSAGPDGLGGSGGAPDSVGGSGGAPDDVGGSGGSGGDPGVGAEPPGVGGGSGSGGQGGSAGMGGSGGCTGRDRVLGTDSCLFAVGHGFYGTAPATTVVYRAEIPQWTNDVFKDASGEVNGFYYQVTVNGGRPNQAPGVNDDDGVRVPFNGFWVGDDGELTLAPFEFTFVVDISETTLADTTVALYACAAQGQASVTDSSACGGTEPLWTDIYGKDSEGGLTLPEPVLAPALAGNNVSLTVSGDSDGSTLSIPGTGVAAGVVTVEVPSSLSEADQDWFFDHLVFVTFENAPGRPFPNDILQEQPGDQSFTSVGVLPLDKGALCTQSGTQSECVWRYSSATQAGQPHTASDSNRRDYLVYRRPDSASDSSTWDVTVGVAALSNTDTGCGNGATCPALFGNDTSLGPREPTDTSALVFTVLTVTGELPKESQISPTLTTTIDTSTTSGEAAPPGATPTRQVFFEADAEEETLCTTTMSPLSTQGLGPNYLVTFTGSLLTTGRDSWSNTGSDGLYYVLPSGYGVCTSSPNGTSADEAPFCEKTNGRGNYVPHYTRSGDASTGTGCVESDEAALNGGSVSELVVDCATVADQYVVNGDSDAGTLVYFDNCGYGHTFSLEESDSSFSRLVLSQETKLSPTYQANAYTVRNAHLFPVVLAKECCMSAFDVLPTDVTSVTTNATDISPGVRPIGMKDTYGTFIAPGDMMDLGTVYADQTMAVYHGLTGALLYKVRLYLSGYASSINENSELNGNPASLSGAPQVYGCPDGSLSSEGAASVTSSSASSSSLTLGSGELLCTSVTDPCPWGMFSAGEIDGYTVCRANRSTVILGTKEWSEQFDDDSMAVRLQAFGVKPPDTTNQDGDSIAKPGEAGFAGTVLTMGDFGTARGYVGLAGVTLIGPTAMNAAEGCGGIATSLFANTGLSGFMNGLGDTVPEALQLIAGGGGAPALPGCAFGVGVGDGGAGAVEVRVSPAWSYSVAALEGGAGKNNATWKGKGAGPDGQGGDGGSKPNGPNGAKGTDGIGGIVYNSTFEVPATGGCPFFSAGSATLRVGRTIDENREFFTTGYAGAPNACGGIGGAGYGAGGSGRGGDPDTNVPGGGGGGGSFARDATGFDPGFGLFGGRLLSQDPSVGSVELWYTTNPGATYQSIERGTSETLGSLVTLLTVGDVDLNWQADGDLAMRATADATDCPGEALWGTGTQNEGAKFEFTTDGNLVISNSAGTAIWSTPSTDPGNRGSGSINPDADGPGTQLVVTSSRRIYIMNADNDVLWQALGSCP